nr:hypothetical protein Itr_chr06CG01050 [Ipomoea trifida]
MLDHGEGIGSDGGKNFKGLMGKETEGLTGDYGRREEFYGASRRCLRFVYGLLWKDTSTLLNLMQRSIYPVPSRLDNL